MEDYEPCTAAHGGGGGSVHMAIGVRPVDPPRIQMAKL
jgi:hypothetical protein